MLSLKCKAEYVKIVQKKFQDEVKSLFSMSTRWSAIWQEHEALLRYLIPKLVPTIVMLNLSSIFVKQRVNLPINSLWIDSILAAQMTMCGHLHQEMVGRGFHLFSFLFQNSCDPNIYTMHFNNLLVYIITKLTPAGSEVYINKTGKFFSNPLLQRQAKFQDVYGMKCHCEACRNNWPQIDDLKAINPYSPPPALLDVSTKEKAMENLKKHIAYFEKNFKPNQPTKEVYWSICCLMFCLFIVAKSSFYP